MENLTTHGSTRAPLRGKLGAPSKIDDEDADALLDELIKSGWMYQDEMARWLLIERGIYVSQSTISRFLKKRGWSARTLRPFSINQNQELREIYRRTMRPYEAEQLVFLDESIFNEKTGWRHHAYAPVGHPARYTQDIARGDTYAILPAYTVNGYLPCTGIKQGYFNRDEFLQWITDHLIPTLHVTYGDRTMVIVLDNVSIHTNDDVTLVLEAAGYVVRYLPPYSPDYNPIELTFAVLKAWIKRNYCYRRKQFSSFSAFLAAAVRESKCDRFARKHFKYSGGGGLYCEQEVLEQARQEARDSLGIIL